MQPTSKMTDYVNEIRNEPITMQALYLQEMINRTDPDVRIIVNDVSIIDKYREELYETAVYRTFTNVEKLTYYYKPWLFCYNIYGTPELWFELLKLNQLSSFMEFNQERIKIFDENVLARIMAILDMEEELIALNTEELTDLKKEAAL